MILIGSPLAVMLSVTRAALALVLLSAGFMGYLHATLGMASRLTLIAAGVMILVPNFWTTLVGVMMGAFMWFATRRMAREGGEISGND